MQLNPIEDDEDKLRVKNLSRIIFSLISYLASREDAETWELENNRHKELEAIPASHKPELMRQIFTNKVTNFAVDK